MSIKFEYKPKTTLEKSGLKVYPHTKYSQKSGSIVAGNLFSGPNKDSKLAKFGVRVYSALVENFSQTFFVGGMVRDTLLKRTVRDIDFATDAEPMEVAAVLKTNGIGYDTEFQKLGIIVVPWEGIRLSITTFRKDIYTDSRYPKVAFSKSIKQDAKRRDFTINSLYLKPESGQVLDYFNGLKDLKNKNIKFIGQPRKRILEDPLRIIRALRFSLSLGFIFDKKTFAAIKNNFSLINNLTKTKVEKEIDKLKNQKHKKIIHEVINNPKMLDKYFKYR
jgi:tRNA nucleotidyltransferase (CCA-adding enzyme)